MCIGTSRRSLARSLQTNTLLNVTQGVSKSYFKKINMTREGRGKITDTCFLWKISHVLQNCLLLKLFCFKLSFSNAMDYLSSLKLVFSEGTQ